MLSTTLALAADRPHGVVGTVDGTAMGAAADGTVKREIEMKTALLAIATGLSLIGS